MTTRDDYELLRRYEPILVYSPDERFFPQSVYDFIRQCALWSVDLRLWSIPLIRRRIKPFKPQEDLDAAVSQLTTEEARRGFIYLQLVAQRVLFPLIGQAWPLTTIEVSLFLLPFAVVLNTLLAFLTPPAGIWLTTLNRLLPGLALGLLVAGTLYALLRRAIFGAEAFDALPPARLRTFQTFTVLQLMVSAILGSLAYGPVVFFARGDQLRGGIFWAAGWLLAYLLARYILKFLRGGILQLSSIFALLSGLNDGTGDAALRQLAESGEDHLPGSTERTYPYYGRVWPQDDASRETYQYIVLQYWFFYPFNDWRTRYNGIDDHEGDWEHISIFLARDEPGGELFPTYVVYSQHILPGAFLRRAWNDPALTKLAHEGELHPVAYVASGSHAHYFKRGRHGLDELLRFNKSASALYTALLATKGSERTAPDTTIEDVDFWIAKSFKLGPFGEYLLIVPKFGLPEIERVDVEELLDYAAIRRGDPFSTETGPSIGPGQMAAWDCVLIGDENPEWMRFNGNWGKYVAYTGESAPRGPRFASKLTDRGEWSDPVAASGLLPLIFGETLKNK